MKSSQDSTHKRNYQDFIQINHQLGITAKNRQRPLGDPTDPNAANFDESKVESFVLPKVLVSDEGNQITAPPQWWEIRRPEIVEDYPVHMPELKWHIIS